MTANVSTSDLYEGVLVVLNDEWRVVDLPTCWGLQTRNEEWRKKWAWPWRTVTATHLRSELAELLQTLTGTSGEVVSALPDVHGRYFGRPAGKRDDEYRRVVCVFGDWRVIIAPGVPQWTVQTRGRKKWRDIGHTFQRNQIAALVEHSGHEVSIEMSDVIRRLPKRYGAS